MKIAIVGMWHLGTVTCNGLAEIGKSITCFDKKDTILKLKSGKFPIFEPGIHRLYNKNKKKIKFDYTFENLKNFNTVWITYDAKINRFDKSNSLEIEKKIKVVLKLLKKNTILIISSQCALGTISRLEKFEKKYIKKGIQFVYIPENYRLGHALKIFFKPDRIVIGYRGKKFVKNRINQIFNTINTKKIFVSIECAEISKHIINSFLANSISFINEIGLISKYYKIDSIELEKCVKSDKRIGYNSYLSIGLPFSGGTLARDVNFLKSIGNHINSDLKLIKSIYKSNSKYSDLIIKKIKKKLNELKSKNILQIGISYTANTSTIRRSFQLDLFRSLKKNFNIKIYDLLININSNEIGNLKKYFTNLQNKTIFDVVICFGKINIEDYIKNTNKNTTFIDMQSLNKNILNHKLNYVDITDVI